MENDDTRNPVADLIAQLVAAFADNPRLPRGSMVYRESWETESLLRNLTRVNDTPTDSFIEWHADSLPDFTPEGLRHVLPYYLRYALLHPESTAAEFVIYHLSPENVDDVYWRNRSMAFSSAQKQAICSCLKHLQVQLADRFYDEHFARALVVWACH